MWAFTQRCSIHFERPRAISIGLGGGGQTLPRARQRCGFTRGALAEEFGVHSQLCEFVPGLNREEVMTAGGLS